MKEFLFPLCDNVWCFLEHCLQILSTAWAFKRLAMANRHKLVLDVYLLSSWVGANETHLVWLPVRLSRTDMHIYEDSWKLTRFVTCPQKPGSEISDCLYFVNTSRKTDQIWRDNWYFYIIAILNVFFMAITRHTSYWQTIYKMGIVQLKYA